MMETQVNGEKATWSIGKRILAVAVALLLALPVNSGSLMSGVAEADEVREAVSTEGWTLSAKWAKNAGGANLEWESATDETKVVRLEVGYSREGTDKAYAPGELSIEVPGIGGAARGRIAAATDVAADPAEASEKTYDWSYSWDKASDTYTFVNNNAIEAGEVLSGSFEILWALKSRSTVNLYEKTLHAEMTSRGTLIASSADVKFSYKSIKDSYYAALSTAALGSSDGLGEDYRDFIWVKYRIQSSRELKSCGLTDARWEVALPEGAKVADVRNGNDSAMDHSVRNDVLSIPMSSNLTYWYSNYQPQITVGFPRDAFEGRDVSVEARLVGTYGDYSQPEVTATAESAFTMRGEDYDFSYTGAMFGVYKTHYSNAKIVYGKLFSESGAEFTYSIGTTARCEAGDDAAVEIVDDFHDALRNDGTLRQLKPGEYHYKSITVPSKSSFKNGNGQAATDGQYAVSVLADTGAGFAEVASLSVDGSSHAVKLPEGTARVKLRVEGVNGVLDLSGVIVVALYHPEADADLLAASAIASEGSIRSTVGLFVEKDGKVVNTPGADSYTGSWADEVAARDLATYGSYVQRGWDSAPIMPSGVWQSYTSASDAGFTADRDGYYNKITVSAKSYNATGETPWASRIVSVALLPSGMHANVENEDVKYSAENAKREGGSLTSSYISDRASIDVERNWRGSGRDLVRITYDFSDDRVLMSSNSGISAVIPVAVPVEEYMEYGDSYRVLTASVYDEAADNQTGYYNYGADNGKWAGADAALMSDIDGDGDTAETVTWASCSTVVALAAATYQSSKETVRTVRTDGVFVSDSYVTSGEEYAWKMQLVTGTTEAADLELTDMFDEPGFAGRFQGVDTAFLQKQGFEPSVSYTADGTTWVPAETWGKSLDDVAGVKVALPGQTVPSGSLVYALVNMKTLDDKSLIGSETENGHTAAFTAIDSNTGQETGRVEITSVPATLRYLDQVGTMEIAKTDAVSGRKLAGAAFEVRDNAGNVVAKTTTNRTGRAQVGELPFGRYTVAEVTAPAGYELAAAVVVDHKAEKTMVTVSDERARGCAKLVKRDASTGAPVSGAAFELTRSQGGFWLPVEGGTYITDDAGEITIENLDWGSYRLTETACEGYELLSNPLNFSVDASTAKGAAIPIQIGGPLGITNRQKPTGIEIVKTSADAEGNDTGVPVEGAEYGLYDIEGNRVATDWTDERGRAEFTDVLHGSYEVREITAAKGHEIDRGAHKVEITRENAGNAVGMRLTDKQKGATLTIIKLDAEGKQRLEGAEFDVLDSAGSLVAHVATDDLGQAQVRDLAWGDYTVQETRAPKGFIAAVDPVPFSAGIDNADTGIELRIDNERKLGSAVLMKTDEETGSPLAGAVYDLYKTDGTIVRDDLPASDTSGEISVDGLTWGSYYFKERTAPAGYSVSGELVRFAVNASTADAAQRVEATDKAGEASIQIVKEITAEDYVAAQGEPTFAFRVQQTGRASGTGSIQDVADGNVKWAQIKFDEATVAGKTGTVKLTATVGGLAANGRYEVTEVDAMRYEPQGEKSMTVNVSAGESAAEFANDKVISQQRSVYSDTDSVLNIVKSGAKVTGMTATWTGGVVTKRTLDPEKLDVEVAYDDGTTRRLGADEYTLEPAELPGGVNGDYLVAVKSTQGGKELASTVTVTLDTPKALKDYTASELQVIADDLSVNGEESEYWAEFNFFLQTDDKWYTDLKDGTRMEFRIIGINHDDKAWAPDDAPDKKAGLTMQATGLLPKETCVNSDGSATYQWKDSVLRKSMQKNGEIYEQFSSLTPFVAIVDKRNATPKSSDIAISQDALWIASVSEMYGTVTEGNENYYLAGDGETYEWYSGLDAVWPYPQRTEFIRNITGTDTAAGWWTRTAPFGNNSYAYITWAGGGYWLMDSTQEGIAPCFCFGTSYEELPEYWIDVPADNAEAKKLGVAGTTLKPADIVAAADDIATKGTSSQYYPMYHSFMEDDVFMKVNWGDGQRYNVRTVGINHDDITGGAGKAGITWQFVDLLNDAYPMNEMNTNNGGWRDSALRANMNSGTIWDQAPVTLQNSIVAVDKMTKNRDDGTQTNNDLKSIPATATSDKLWIMSYGELVDAETFYSPWNCLEGEGVQYEYWNGKGSNNNSPNECFRKWRPARPSQACGWWQRSVYPVYPGQETAYAIVNIEYPAAGGLASESNYVCPAFCMGEPAPQYWIEREDGSIMKPAEIEVAAEDISAKGEASEYWQQFRNYMENGGDWDTASNTPGPTFGQALEDGYGLMHIMWGDGREYTARIVGMNHDDKSDGTGKAGLTFQFTGLLYDYYAMHGQNKYVSDSPYNTNNGGWRDSILRKWMNPDELTERTSIMDGETDDNRVWNRVPASLQSSIVAVDKWSKNRDDGTTTNNDLKTIPATATSDKLWITSYPELVEACYSGWNGLEGEGAQYRYWNGKVTQNYNSNACLKKYRAKYLATSSQPTSASFWWERSVRPTNTTDFARVGNSGDPSNSVYASDANGVCPCFCL